MYFIGTLTPWFHDILSQPSSDTNVLSFAFTHRNFLFTVVTISLHMILEAFSPKCGWGQSKRHQKHTRLQLATLLDTTQSLCPKVPFLHTWLAHVAAFLQYLQFRISHYPFIYAFFERFLCFLRWLTLNQVYRPIPEGPFLEMLLQYQLSLLHHIVWYDCDLYLQQVR